MKVLNEKELAFLVYKLRTEGKVMLKDIPAKLSEEGIKVQGRDVLTTPYISDVLNKYNLRRRNKKKRKKAKRTYNRKKSTPEQLELSYDKNDYFKEVTLALLNSNMNAEIKLEIMRKTLASL